MVEDIAQIVDGMLPDPSVIDRDEDAHEAARELVAFWRAEAERDPRDAIGFGDDELVAAIEELILEHRIGEIDRVIREIMPIQAGDDTSEDVAGEAREYWLEQRDTSGRELRKTNEAMRAARAANHIDAIELSGGRFAYHANETSTWWVVTRAELASLADYLEHEDPEIARDAYSHWCAGASARELPRGWEPYVDWVLVERIPEHLRASHEAAGNWGVYPHNGAERVIVRASDAPSGDAYDRVLRDATIDDFWAYEIGAECR